MAALHAQIKKIIFSPFFLALFPTLAISLLIPEFKYRYDVDSKVVRDIMISTIYADLDSDKISEKISLWRGSPFYFIDVKDKDNRVHHQWNLHDSISREISMIFTGNFDGDRYSEIYVFTHNGDSLFLNVNELHEPCGLRKEGIFITRIGYWNNKIAAVLSPAGFFDEDGDGFLELYFSVSSNFRLGPRKAYLFNFVTNSLKSSARTCTTLLSPEMSDADGDHRQEFYGSLSGSGNYLSKEPYSDSSTWFMVLNDHLDFEFPPVEFPGFANGMKTLPFNNGYAILHWAAAADTTIKPSRILLYTDKGKFIRERLLQDIGINVQPHFYVIKNNGVERIVLIGNNLVSLDNRLEITQQQELPADAFFNTYTADVDNNGENEILISYFDLNRLVICNAGEIMTDVEFTTPSPLWTLSSSINKDGTKQVYIKSGNQGVFLNMKRNKQYYAGFLVYPAIYLSILLFIILIRKMNTLQIVHREHLKQRLLTLQLQAIKLQLDPHFTFNTLNTVASFIYLQDRQEAYDIINKFTILLRKMINDAEKIYRPLEEEIEFVRLYLDLEKLRFGGKLSYEIKVNDDVQLKEEVPKLVLHTFAENAVKHGISTRAEGGTLKIIINMDGRYLRIIVEDNGIGRSASAGQIKSTGKGLKLTREFYDILGEIDKKPVKYKITDLFDGFGNPAGTRVEILVSVEYETNLPAMKPGIPSQEHPGKNR